MKHVFPWFLFLVWVPLSAQEETPIDTAVSQEEEAGVQPEESDVSDTTVSKALTESVVDTAETVALEEVPLSLDAGYKGFAWGMTQDQFKDYVEFDSVGVSGRNDVITVFGVLGEDSAKFSYFFSDTGFWKVTIDYPLQLKALEDYRNHFSRIERILSKRYGSPKRTTQNEMGTDMEYLFSDFPKLSRGYFRSSWVADPARIELLLEAVVPNPEERIPVFDDVATLVRLYYYNPEFYRKSEPPDSEISEEALLDAY